MKIHILSDLHLERWAFEHSIPDCDVVVLAGDIGVGVDGIEWARDNIPSHVNVVYVAGNHEFYGEPLWDHYERMKAECVKHGIHFIQNDQILIGDVLFVGGTLWTDYNLLGQQDIGMLAAPNITNDYKCIDLFADEGFSGCVTPNWLLQEHKITRHFISQIIQQTAVTKFKTVVVTHHAPSELSITQAFKGHNSAVCYASRLENLMLDYSPILWIHGHLHTSSDYMVGDTRVIANPRGSEVYSNKTFNKDLVIEI